VFGAFSLHRESPDLDTGRWTPHFWGGSITEALGTQEQRSGRLIASGILAVTGLGNVGTSGAKGGGAG
jgi:hypothetical protein